MKKIALLSLVIIIILLFSSLPVMSYSPFSDQVKQIYKQQISCEVCHTGANLNSYGLAFKKSWQETKDLKLIDAFRNIEKLDSDNDGISNKKELSKGTLPGDKLSFPKNEIRTNHKK